MSTKLTKPQVIAATGLGDRTIDRWEFAGNFPKRRYRENGYIYWLDSEIQKWLKDRDKFGLARGGYSNA